MRATVRNRGGVGSTPTVVTFYFSNDPTFHVGPTTVGSAQVNGLDAGESVFVEATYTVTRAGIYYYYACVERIVDDPDTGNDCSTGVRLEVSGGPAPDLVVLPLSVNPSTVYVGDTFDIDATVRNDGDVTSAATTLKYYRSNDYRFPTRGTQVGTDSVRSLAPGRTDEEGTRVTASIVGTHYYRACVDSVPGEDNTSNNCSRPHQVETVPQPQLYGGIAASVSGVSCGNTDGAVVVNYRDSAQAELAARRACESKTGGSCAAAYFTSRCGAVVYGKDTDIFGIFTIGCSTFDGFGERGSSAVNQATRRCQQYREDCTEVLDWGCNSR